MTESAIHSACVWTEIGLGVVTFASLFFFVAPYGRHQRAGFGPPIRQRLAWIVMESPAVVLWLAIYALGAHALSPGPLAIAAIWQLHYVQRTFVYPMRIRAGDKTTPLMVVVSALVFNTLNAYVNARWVSEFGDYPTRRLAIPRFLFGAALFFAGFVGNVSSDGILVRLRERTAPGTYAVPEGGLFRWVSSPNYLAEIVEWIGWAILTWSVAGASFAIYTAANLVPRALSNHRWYKARFADYPADRRALVPFLL